MNNDISKEQWNELDQLIIENKKLQFNQMYQKLTNCSVRDLIIIKAERYRHLKEVCPEKFKLTDEEYWDGYYS
jgi:hypothetical protein